LLAAAVAFVLVGGASFAQEKPTKGTPGKAATEGAASRDPIPSREKEVISERRDDAAQAAAEYEFSFDNDTETPVKLRSEPVLRWPNHERGAAQGGTFLWTARGVPVALCDIFWYKGSERHFAFHSLTQEPILVEMEGRVVWHPRRAGVELVAVPGAAAPAASATARLPQMRNMAREFQAATLGPNDKDAEQLRLLTQPLYRYESTDPQIEDGALFTFVTGTDPEVVLQLEARNDGKGKSVWHYGLTRRSGFPLRVRYQEKIVWSVPPGQGGKESVYYER
jgi:hypothetical protein